VKDQAGKVRIAADKTPEDGALLGMDYFVQGVIGTTE
jgi:basic membrane protein A